jgi:hypothetical protein
MNIKEIVGDLFGFNQEINTCKNELLITTSNLNNTLKVLNDSHRRVESLEEQLKLVSNQLDKKDLDAEYWNSKYPVANVEYVGRTWGTSKKMIPIDVRLLVTPQDFHIHDILKANNLYYVVGNNIDDHIVKVYHFIKAKYYKYVYDQDNYGVTEYWEFPYEILESLKKGYSKGADCLEENTEIITDVGYKKIKDLTIDDKVLSYNFETKESEFKKVLNVWDKGILPTKKLSFMGGVEIISTNDHKFYFRTDNKNGVSEYQKQRLSEHDFENSNRNMKNKVPYLIKQPYLLKDIEELSENDCFIIGYYLAEGWGSKTKNVKYLCGYELDDNVLPILDDLNITYNYYTNSHGCPQINLHKSYLNKYLDMCGRTSYEKNIPNELKNLPINKLKKIIEGYHLGDGSKGNLKRVVFTTVSEKLADDVTEILNKIGRPSNKFFIKDCGGFGHSEVYRIDVNDNSYRNRNYGYNNLSENTLINIEDFEEKQVYDIEVEDNHNFFLKNGILVGNCDSWASFIISFLIASGVPEWKCRVVVGMSKLGGHSTCYCYCDKTNKFHHLNSTMGAKSSYKKLEEYPTTDDAETTDPIGIYNVWLSYNNLFSWHKFSSEAKADFIKEKGKEFFIIK